MEKNTDYVHKIVGITGVEIDSLVLNRLKRIHLRQKGKRKYKPRKRGTESKPPLRTV